MRNFFINVFCVVIVVLSVLIVGYLCFLPIAAIGNL